MIPSIANPTKFVEKYRTVWIYSPWRFLPPRNTPDSFCRRFTRQNHRCAAWAVFFFSGKPYLENFMSRPNVIPTFRQRHCTNRGRNFVRSKRWPHYMSSTTSTYFCVLTIRKHLLKMRFERSGRGQEPSRGHKFSILENSCPFGTASCWGVPAPNPARWFHSWWLLYCLYAFSNPDLLYMINL